MDKQDWKERRSYHKVSGHSPQPKPPRGNRRLLLLSVPLIAAIVIFNSGGLTAEPAASSSGVPSVTPPVSAPASQPSNTDSMRIALETIADGEWGYESLDVLALVAKDMLGSPSSTKEESAIEYLQLILSGASPDEASDELLKNVAFYLGASGSDGMPTEEIDRYRRALANVHVATQSVSQSSSASGQ